MNCALCPFHSANGLNCALCPMQTVNGLNCDCANCPRSQFDPVNGVGTWAGFMTGVGNFIGSDFGKALISVGVTVGTSYAIKELGLTATNTKPGGSMTGSGYVNPATSQFNPMANPAQPAQPIVVQSAGGEIQKWLLPAVIGIGALTLVLAVRK